MLFTKANTYALLAIYELARLQRDDGNTTSGVQASHISRVFNLPSAYAAKIMSQLTRRGILRSDRGPSGGFRLNKPASQITLWDVIDGDNAMSDKSPEYAICPPNIQATLTQVTSDAKEQLRQLLKSVTIEQMVDEPVTTHH